MPDGQILRPETLAYCMCGQECLAFDHIVKIMPRLCCADCGNHGAGHIADWGRGAAHAAFELTFVQDSLRLPVPLGICKHICQFGGWSVSHQSSDVAI